MEEGTTPGRGDGVPAADADPALGPAAVVEGPEAGAGAGADAPPRVMAPPGGAPLAREVPVPGAAALPVARRAVVGEDGAPPAPGGVVSDRLPRIGGPSGDGEAPPVAGWAAPPASVPAPVASAEAPQAAVSFGVPPSMGAGVPASAEAEPRRLPGQPGTGLPGRVVPPSGAEEAAVAPGGWVDGGLDGPLGAAPPHTLAQPLPGGGGAASLSPPPRLPSAPTAPARDTAAATPAEGPAWQRHAAARPEAARPGYALVLIDPGFDRRPGAGDEGDPTATADTGLDARGRAAVAAALAPVTVAIDPGQAGARAAAQAWRAAGHEVAILLHGSEAGPEMVAAALRVLPEAVALVIAEGAVPPAAAEALATALAEAGLGLVTPAAGLDAAGQAARRAQVPAARLAIAPERLAAGAPLDLGRLSERVAFLGGAAVGGGALGGGGAAGSADLPVVAVMPGGAELRVPRMPGWRQPGPVTAVFGG